MLLSGANYQHIMSWSLIGSTLDESLTLVPIRRVNNSLSFKLWTQLKLEKVTKDTAFCAKLNSMDQLDTQVGTRYFKIAFKNTDL